MKTKQFRPLLLLACLQLVVSLACNLPVIGNVSAPKLPFSGGNAVNNLTDVHKAVIQIEAQGTFLDPEVGLEVNAAGRGSGFIIDPSGIAVTNNHVVTGAALVKVWLDGESEPRYAKVLGYSECNDLAVIKIEGKNFSYLDWFNGSVTTGMEIYLAGYPLGEPEFSLTKGIVSKEHTSGDTSWTAISGGVISHDATSNPGNSGGPIVDKSGKVVGVNFASRASASQYFAIPSETAQDVVAELEKKNNFESIGVNGNIVSNESGSLTGIWVSSVASGSPADKAGLKAGDIITQMENLVLGTDGTMSDYCSIIRTHDAGATLSITVLRWPTKEVLEGQINGRKLEVVKKAGDADTDGSKMNYGTMLVNMDGFNYFFSRGGENLPGLFSVYYLDGKLYFDVDSEGASLGAPYLYYEKKEYTDSRITVVVENPKEEHGYVETKLVCRLDPDKSWYEFVISSNGHYEINYWLDDHKISLRSMTENDSINRGSIDKYAATCVGDEFSLFIDDELIDSVKSVYRTSGFVGLGVSTFIYTTSIFDSFEIATP